MKKLILYIAMSLDGYLADEQGDVAWLEGDGSDASAEGSYPSFYESIDHIIIGRRTYEQIVNELAVDQWPYSDKDCYVLTQREQLRSPEGEDRVYCCHQSLEDLLETLPEQRIWLCGGAQIVHAAMQSDLIDEYRISVIPHILGRGIPLFLPSEQSHRLRLTGMSQCNGVAELCYVRRNDA